MDDQTLDALRAAFTATPSNTPLLKVLLDAYLERGEAHRAIELLDDKSPADFGDPDELLSAAQVLLDAGEARRSVEFAEAAGDLPEGLLLRARAHLELGERDQGRRLYAQAIAENAALEDPDLASALAATVREIASADGKPKLRVISNDDTTETELDRLFIPEHEQLTFEQVGGLSGIKDQIRRKIILPFEKPGLFQKFRKKVGGGILLYGPPGCGKTLLARATAGECNAAFLNVSIADVLDMYIGESEQKLHALFEKARGSTPSVLFFDEIEALGGKRQYTREATSSKLVSQFLAEMDGFNQNNQGVLILGATNVPWAVDPAFRRPGRFDRVLFVPPPDREARAAILDLLLQGRPCGDDLDLDFVAKNTSGFSGADLENIVETAADRAIEDSIESGREQPISRDQLRAALREVKSTTVEWLTTARNYARYSNEAGHYDEVLEFLKKYGKA